MKKILLIEDNIHLRNLVKRELKKYDFSVFEILNFKNIFADIDSLSPDFILLDINLPYFDGFHILKTIRKKSDIPVIIISSRDSIMDQIMGLELGADDYLVKPFSFDLLMAKIKTIIRRSSQKANCTSSTSKINNLPLALDHNDLTLIYKNNFLELTKNEFNILDVLNSNNNRIVRREELLSRLWDENTFVDDNTLTVNMTRVKNKLKLAGLNHVIKTKRGVGYKLCINNNEDDSNE